MDPVTIAMAGAGLIKGLMDQAAAKKTSREAQAFQQQNLADSLMAARQTNSERMLQAGALRQDQFGNATYYDPAQGRWVTYYTPTQQRLIDQGQERQGRANTRGAQASSDYDTLRGEYLYQKPKSEAESYAEIVNLINQAQGTGERQLSTLMNRFGIRTAGNLPQLVQMDRGPSPGQQLAETMLKARQAALGESQQREAGHQSKYLPALKQFENTANYMAPVDPTGSSIVAMGEQGRQAQQGALGDFEKLVATIYGQGGTGMNNASALGVKADTSGPQAGDFMKMAQLLQNKGGKTGSTGSNPTSLDSTGASTYSSSGSGGTFGSGGPFGNLGGSNSTGTFDPYGDAAYKNIDPSYWGSF